MKLKKLALYTTFSILSAFSRAQAQTQVLGADALRAQLGLSAHPVSPESLAQVKVAVLDNGFMGFEAGRDLLPSSAQLIAGSANPLLPDPHGLGMAQILWALAQRFNAGPQFWLINSNGFTNFKAAIDFVVQNKIDIVLYSQNWTFGSNFDGTGFLNQEVSRATQAGALWINSAGNFHNLTYTSSVLPLDESTGYVKLPSERNSLTLVNELDANPVTLTLSWNDFENSDRANSSKDLDLYIYNERGTLLPTPNKIQEGRAPSGPDDTHSSFARETWTLNLDRGTYQIKIQPKSKNFTSRDLFRVVLSTPKTGSLDLVEHKTKYEILPPAESADVITVGDCSEISSQGPTLDGRLKPDVVVPDSRIEFSDGNRTYGSSTAAAMVAGAAAVLRAENPSMSAQAFSTAFKNLVAQMQPLPSIGCAATLPVWNLPR